jgi:hypothetical protein
MLIQHNPISAGKESGMFEKSNSDSWLSTENPKCPNVHTLPK